MTIISPPAAACKETGIDSIVSSPGTKLTDSSTSSRKEESDSSILSPSAVSQISQEENVGEEDDDSENDNTWKGDSWSQEDVR